MVYHDVSSKLIQIAVSVYASVPKSWNKNTNYIANLMNKNEKVRKAEIYLWKLIL